MTIKESVLFTKKKKKSGWWRAQPLSSGGRRRAVTTRTRSRRPQAPGPEALPPLLPGLETPRAGVGESQTQFRDREAAGSLTLARGWKTARIPRRAAGQPGSPSSGAPRALFPSGPRAGHACLCTRAHTRAHRYIHTHTHTHTGPQHIAPHAPARPRSTRLGSAPERPRSRGAPIPSPKARAHTLTRAAGPLRRLPHSDLPRDPGSRRPPRSPRPVLPSLHRVFYE